MGTDYILKQSNDRNGEIERSGIIEFIRFSSGTQ